MARNVFTRTELLLPTDPLLPSVVAKASTDPAALEWVRDSARLWAREEFVKRELRREDGDEVLVKTNLEQRVFELRRHQVAVRVNDSQPFSADRPDHHRIIIGLLSDDSDDYYVQVSLGFGGSFGGMVEVADIVELPECYRVQPWPPKPRAASLRRT